MATKHLPTPEELRQLLRYEPETGKLFWRERGPEWFDGDRATVTAKIWNGRFAGKEAFTTDDGDGYRAGGIFGNRLRAARVVWAIYHGKWPEGVVDHINRVRDDNRIANLRDVDLCVNRQNRTPQPYLGVGWHNRSKRWRARFRINGKRIERLFLRREDAVHFRATAAPESFDSSL